MQAYAGLIEVCRKLRGPGGCPWDREQTLTSMTPYMTEEAVESGEAIASGDKAHIAEATPAASMTSLANALEPSSWATSRSS